MRDHLSTIVCGCLATVALVCATVLQLHGVDASRAFDFAFVAVGGTAGVAVARAN